MPVATNIINADSPANVGRKNAYTLPLILVTSLFFLWGMAYGLLDVLNKHFQVALNITRARSMELQAAYFGAYFLMALPAGILMNRYGYKKGILLGLLLYAVGAFLFYPAAEMASFNFFLLALFIVACGLTCLETAANPYVTVLGDKENAPFRLNLSQCFNGFGSFIGPLIGGALFFGSENQDGMESVQMIYLIIGGIVLLIAGLFFRTPLPEIEVTAAATNVLHDKKPLFSYSHFRGAVIAQFFYVAAQVGVAALFINYCTESGSGIDDEKASYLLSISLLLFTAGRFAGTALMRRVKAELLLTTYALINVLLCVVVIMANSQISVYSLMAIFFFESIMFPTIFALGLKGLGPQTKRASSFIIMSIVGGALVPQLMGYLADWRSTAFSFIVPLVCFIIVAWYGWKGSKEQRN